MNEKLTIVGPEPSRSDGTRNTGRVNIEALLLMAKYDDEFRRLLIEKREKAIAECGIDFSPSERLILLNTSRNKLESGIREFSPTGVTRESLPSWKEAAAVIFFLLSLVVGDVSCAGMPVGGAEPDGVCRKTVSESDLSSYKEGFCGSDTFRLKGFGIPEKTVMGINSRKDSAMKSAVLIAQVMILEKFVGACISGTGIMHDDYVDNGLLQWREQVKDVVKKGSVVAASWDADQNCSIIYEIKKAGLKDWVKSCY